MRASERWCRDRKAGTRLQASDMVAGVRVKRRDRLKPEVEADDTTVTRPGARAGIMPGRAGQISFENPARSVMLVAVEQKAIVMKSEVVQGLARAGWPVLLVDEAGVVRSANPAAAQAFGATFAQGSAPLALVWLAENESAPEEFLARWERAPGTMPAVKLLGEGGVTNTYQACLCSLVENLEKRFLLQLLPPVPGGVKTPTMDVGLAHKQKLDCALQLARTVSLDFNNALTSILGHTSLVLSKMEAGNPWRASLMEVEKSAAKAAEIANDLGAFSRAEKENKSQFVGNVNQLLQRNVETFKSVKLDKEVTWSLQLERRLYLAKFDEAKMQQALLKVMENAVEALGPHGRVILQTKNLDLTQPTQDRNAQLAAGSYVCVEITDNGGGIEAEVLPRIFEPFFTTKRGGHRGLGLAWVYGIVTNHGGGVAVSSQAGSGTSVRIYLPADKKYAKEEVDSSTDLTGTQTILMVDDEDLLLTMGETILSAYGYKVLTANSGQKALDILAKSTVPIDLVITDLVMPNMSGRDLVEHVRRISPETRIVSSSGYVRPAEEQGDTDYLQKPFTSQDLLLKVKQALGAEPVD
jgi:nitrogen-specific signal transduction histidine kinase